VTTSENINHQRRKALLAHSAAVLAVVGAFVPTITVTSVTVWGLIQILKPVAGDLIQSNLWVFFLVLMVPILACLRAAWEATHNYFAYQFWPEDVSKTERWPPEAFRRVQIALIMILVFAGFAIVLAMAIYGVHDM
jgi:hypothetical protein